nr:hypothetical protein [Burkholderia ubonensis]
MDAPDTALHGQDMPVVGRLYMAFELGEKNWKLSLGDGVRGPSHCTVVAGDTASVLAAIAKAKARCRLAVDAPRYAAAMRPAATASGCIDGWPGKASLTWWWIRPVSK